MAGLPILTVMPEELRQFVALVSPETIAQVPVNVGATPLLSGPMPESISPDAHVRACTAQTVTVASSAVTGIGTLVEAALSFASSFETTDLTNAAAQEKVADPLTSSARNCWQRDPLATDADSPAQAEKG
ncbi:hypothetical protein [Flindersiella endophytica]